MTSIALPAAGTGNLGYPRDKVAAAMFDEVKNFSVSNPRTSLRDIRFSVFDQPTVQVLLNCFCTCSPTCKTHVCTLYKIVLANSNSDCY